MDNASDPHSGPASTSAVVDRYQQHCQRGIMPDLAGFVASAPALDPRDLAALVHVDQRHRHAAGATLPAESYFESFPALRKDNELALDVVYQEYVLRRDAGEAYATDKYLARFPDLAEQLAMQFDLDGAMGDEHSSVSMANPQATVEQSPAYPPGTVIAGRYKLLEEIGEGGMGAVWVAQQTEPVRRRVALKLIKPGMDSRQVLSRFEAERQALAMMDHPHIAKVLDGGMTDQGRPYFVMEYVKGEPITDYCDHARLSVKERLKLFVQVCQAVQHAHQKGIIHRDLKPSNILVCPYDGQPVPKVIDFGLAKAMHQSLTEHSLYTAHGVMVGTPLYMSPEQAETNNLDIDTRSDLYSLGVILYELLTGSTPLEKRRLQDAALQEMLRLIQQEEPPKPSTRLGGSGSLPSIAAQRSLEPAQLSRAVRGDLDWIVMKSLEKERSRRYETANGLARDIERYLHDDPVEARPPSAGYRFSKFARRNKGALLTVGLVTAALVVGTIVSTSQAIRATRAEQLAQDERLDAEKQRAQAEANFQKAKAAVDKYFTLVSDSTLLDVPGLESLRKDLLESALEFYEDFSRSRVDDAAVLTDVAATYLRMSAIYHALNRADDSIAAIQSSLDVIERVQRDAPEKGDLERKLAGFSKGMRLTVQDMPPPGDLLAAVQTLSRLERTWKQLADRYPSDIGFQADLVSMQSTIGIALAGSGHLKEGIEYLSQARGLGEKLVKEHPAVPQYRADLADVQQALAGALGAAGHTDVALAAVRRSAELYEGLVKECPLVPTYRARLAECLAMYSGRFSQTRPQEREQLLRRGMKLTESLVQEFPKHRFYLQIWAQVGAAWASFEISRGNDAGAREVVQKLIEPLEARIEENRDDRGTCEQLAWLCHRTAEALPRRGNLGTWKAQLHLQASVLFGELAEELPNDSTCIEYIGHSFRNLGWIALEAGCLDEANQNFEKADVAFAKLTSDDVPQQGGLYRALHADTLNDLTRVLAADGRTQDALLAARKCVAVCEALARDYPGNWGNYWREVSSLNTLAEVLAQADRGDESMAIRQRMNEMWGSLLDRQPKERQERQQLAWALSRAAGELHCSPQIRNQLLQRALTLDAALGNEQP